MALDLCWSLTRLFPADVVEEREQAHLYFALFGFFLLVANLVHVWLFLVGSAAFIGVKVTLIEKLLPAFWAI